MREMTFMEAAREGLAEEMARDPMIFVVGEGIGERGGNYNTTTGLYALYGPWRLRDTPICERGFTTMCTGAAVLGARPVVDFDPRLSSGRHGRSGEPDREDPVVKRWAPQGADAAARLYRSRGFRGPPFRRLFSFLHACARFSSCRAGYAAGCQGAAKDRPALG
ncbi:MAG: hypothetical protein FJZ90_03490 [Chloroflexi bacterium]|nr:hypothetical protein [Chloroflexota bacterium]